MERAHPANGFSVGGEGKWFHEEWVGLSHHEGPVGT